MVSAGKHLVSIFQVLNPKTQKLNLTHDWTIMGESCGEWSKAEKPAFVQVSDEGSNKEID